MIRVPKILIDEEIILSKIIVMNVRLMIRAFYLLGVNHAAGCICETMVMEQQKCVRQLIFVRM